MSDPIRILHLEDDIIDAQLIHAKLEADKLHCDILRVKDRQGFENAVSKGTFDLIMSDFSVPHYDGYAALKFAREKHPDIPFILVSGTLGEEQAVNSLKSGATDYIVKQRLERLGPAVSRALTDARERKEHEETERKLRKDAQASEARFRTLVEEALVGIYVIEEDRFVYVNPSMTRILGYTAEEMTSRPLLDFIFPDDRALVGEKVRQRLHGEELEAHYSLRMLRRDKSLAFVEARGRRIDFNGRPSIMGTLLDVTERKLAENAIREQAALLDKAQDAICVNDMEQQILFWNKSAERLYGWNALEALGKNANDLLFQGDLGAMQAIPNLLRDGEWKGELIQVTRTGQKLIVESRWSLLRDENGHPKSILIINTDVTEKRQTEAKLLRTQRMESIGALAGGIAHDLNNSLAPILMAAELIQDELQTEEGRALLDTMTKSAQRGADMVKQILSFSRGVTGAHVLLDLKTVIADMEKFARSTFPRGIRVQTEIANELPQVMGDATQIHQVLMNLCINARDAMPNGGELRIKASLSWVDSACSKRQVDGPHVVMCVSDTGQGMPPEVIGKIFEPFFTTKEMGKGTGLGLSTVIEIVKTHRGFVEVSSVVGKGTAFHVFLPAATKHGSSADQKRSSPPSGTGQLILVVDDDTAFLEMSKLVFEAYNYQIVTARDGVEGLAYFQQQHRAIKVVITDMMMPNLSGPELIRKLREINPSVKIIGVSGVASEKWQANVDKVNVDAFLKKPFSTESLLLELNQLVHPQSVP